jgi:accessory Sec system glycosyltransferase GtfB
MRVNIFDYYNDNSRKLLRSLDVAGLKYTTFFVHYQGELPKNSVSPFSFFLGINESNGNGLFFNQVKVPEFYDIRHSNNNDATIEFFERVSGRINYRKDGYRLVESVDWYEKEDTTILFKKDLYNLAGTHYATIFYSRNEAYLTEYYAMGKLVISENHLSRSINLWYQNEKYIFSNLTDFFLFFLKIIDIDIESININSLAYPLFIARSVGEGQITTLFWQESMNEIPGNMVSELISPLALRQIIFNQESYLKTVQAKYPNTILKLGYLAELGTFTRENKYRKQAFILTNSDDLNGIEILLKEFSDLKVTIAARTNISQKLANLGEKYENVTLLPSASDSDINNEINNSDIYLDINGGLKVGNIISRAYQEHMIILSLKSVNLPTYKSIVVDDIVALRDKLAFIFSSEQNWRLLLKEMRTQLGTESSIKDYKRLLK